MLKYNYIIIPSIILGIISRLSMLRVDYRQYPSYPQGVFSHFTLGIVSSSLGAVALPALLEKEFSAVTFLALAAQQFREVRNLERQSLENIDKTELVARGTAYIEDIAKAFEARNYMTMMTSLFVSLAIFIFDKLLIRSYSILLGGILGLLIIVLFHKIVSRELIGEIADIYPAKISFKGPILTVNGIGITNIGLTESREIFLEKGMAVEIVPKNQNAVVTLSNLGQRKAIEHNVAIQLGIRKDLDQPDFAPYISRDPDTGNLVFVIVSMENDIEYLILAVKRTLVLESAKRKPLSSYVGKKAAD
ncbi:YIEGIA family protein [Anaerosalibacter massiliensis]|uniref:YIEGIA family protein n=1 Tax=Anaerosalibacter massiliensis TaxID=1347392 RepID=A0A9X2S5F0_9FIRM|nr:YIEGIA family protein [Anaerosalibacter massiliensis]MCR2042542.1 YIEGIA family protein [Anaerosalibacter massiliensis]